MGQDRNTASSATPAPNLAQAVLAHRRGPDDDAKWRYLETLATTMERLGHARDDPVRTSFKFIGDRWSSLVLFTLNAGTWRYGELKRIISSLAAEEQITQRMLTLTLRALEREGLVSNQMVQGRRLLSFYQLTTAGKELVGFAEAIVQWVESRNEEIAECRAVFDKSHEDHNW